MRMPIYPEPAFHHGTRELWLGAGYSHTQSSVGVPGIPIRWGCSRGYQGLHNCLRPRE